MESLAQELLDAIIDYVPPRHAHSCSLVARRWRKWSQRRIFRDLQLIFSREDDLVRWCRDIPQDPDGIPSYVQHVEFRNILYWSDPEILGRVLKCLSRVKVLAFCRAVIPSGEVPNIVSSGAFGQELTSLALAAPCAPVQTLMLLISSPPNLRELAIMCNPSSPRAPVPLAPEHVWKRKPLQTLRLFGLLGEEIEYIMQCGITSHKLDLFTGDEMIDKVVACSSETVEKLVLSDTTPVGATPFVTHLPPLLALTTVEVAVCHGSLTARLAGFLSLIRSAPALSSVIFHDLYPGDAGDIVDDTLAQLAMQVKAKRSLTVVLEGWMGENTKWKEYFPKFRKTGGQVVKDEIL